jgi:hypothetical protein
MTWLYVPSACVPASPESTLDSALPIPAYEPSVTSSGKHFPPRSWSRAWQTKPWMMRLSGLMLAPSMANRGVAAWISLLRGSPASPSVLPDSARVCQTPDSSGEILSALLARWSPDTSFLRTCQASLPLMGELSSIASFPRWSSSGSIVNGTYSVRRKRVPRTAASAGSAWPTPDAGVSTRSNTSPGPAGERPNLAKLAPMWQTPGTDSFRSRGGDRKDEMGLDQQARLWATPTVQDGKNTAGPSQFGRNSHPLNVEAVQWATPRAEHDSGRHRGQEDTLHSQIKSQWPTPTTVAGISAEGRDGGPNLARVVSTHQPETTGTDGRPLRRVLNPRFAEMLMGWPPGWTQSCLPIDRTDYERWEMASSRLLRQLRGWN